MIGRHASLRRALHEIADVLADALEEDDRRAAAGLSETKLPRKRGRPRNPRAVPPVKNPERFTPEELAEAAKRHP
jgi:hypothetical protein